MRLIRHRRFEALGAAVMSAALVCAGAWAAAADSDDSAQAKAKLSIVRARIAALTKHVGDELKQRDGLSARLRETELVITAQRRRLDGLRAEQAAAERRRAELRAEQSRERTALQSERAALAAQLTARLAAAAGVVAAIAAVAAALVNIGVNAWNLIEVRLTLGFTPYNRGYFQLLPPTIVVAVITLALNRYRNMFRHDWLALGAALALAYGVFAAMILAKGLDADDRLILDAIWSRVRGALAGGARA